MITLLLAMFLASDAQAQDEDPPPAEEVGPVDVPSSKYVRAMQGVRDLERSGEPDAARALATWIARQSDVGPVADDVDALVQTLPGGPSLVGPKVRLIAFEAAAGAWLLGGHPAITGLYGDSEGLYFLGALVGGGAGTLGAVTWMRRPGFDEARFDALVGSQQLGAYNLAMLLAASGSHSLDTRVSLGASVGALGGTAAGLWWAEHDPHPVAPVAMRSGMFWGLGLTALGLTYGYAWDDLSEQNATRIVLAGSDLGAAIGLALPHLLPVTRDQVRFANLGGVIGATSAFVFVSTTANLIWYMPHDVALAMGGAGVAGGALGVILSNRLDHAPAVPVADAMFRTEGGRLRIAVPLPHPMRMPDDHARLALGVSFVDQAF